MADEMVSLKKTDVEHFKRGLIGIIETFRQQEFGQMREFAFNGLKSAIAGMVESLERGTINETIIFKGSAQKEGKIPQEK